MEEETFLFQTRVLRGIQEAKGYREAKGRVFQNGEGGVLWCPKLLRGKVRDAKCALGLPTKWPLVKAVDGRVLSSEQGWCGAATWAHGSSRGGVP